MRKLFSLIAMLPLFMASAWATEQKPDPNANQEQMIYIMPDYVGWQLVEQCTRSFYYPDVFWRVTKEQVDAMENFLLKHIDHLKQQKAEFIPQELSSYKRQYIGFELDGQSYIYGNFFPKNIELEVDPARKGVVSCRGDKRYWGMLFNIDSFKFEAIERNDKMVKPKGAFDPRYWDNKEPATQETPPTDESKP